MGGQRASAARLILCRNWLQEAEAHVFTDLRRTSNTTTTFTGHREGVHRRVDRYTQLLLEPKLGDLHCPAAQCIFVQVPFHPAEMQAACEWHSDQALLQCLGRLATL